MSLAEDIRASLAGGPDTVRVAPGRVNLIGEHTDYSLLPVIPMTIDRSVEVQASVSSATGIRIDSERFPDPIEMYGDLELESLSGWHRYAWAACSTVEAGVGADIFIGGDLPAHGGLSSSSALTIALIAALSDLEGRYRTDDEIVDDAVAAERLTGVEGGTMDQNVIVRGRQGHALRIDFAPFALTHLPIPPGMSFVAAYSGRAAAKGESAKELYNGAVASCRLAAMLLAESLGVSLEPPYGLWQVVGAAGLGEAIQMLPERSSASELRGLDMFDLGVGVESDTPLRIRACAEHVLTEAIRVDDAERALEGGDLSALGQLFDASHESLRRFGASTDALDGLTASMRTAGAAGARLTGAGFGGYAIAVCRPDQVSDVCEAANATSGGGAFPVMPTMGLR